MRARLAATHCAAQGRPKAKIRQQGVRFTGESRHGRHTRVYSGSENGEASNGDGPSPGLPDYQWPAPDLDDVMDVATLHHKLRQRDSPFVATNYYGGGFVDDEDRVSLSSIHFASPESTGATDRCRPRTSVAETMDDDEECELMPTWALRAGARRRIYFEPSAVTAAIVTCGGLCPGLNDVVQGLVQKLTDYGVPEGGILGIRYGFQGFYNPDCKPLVLTPAAVEGIQLQGGTILGTSRGGANIREIVKRLDMWGVSMLFVVGGNGGHAGADAIHQMCTRENVVCAIVGIPKSIDNDILLVDRCFGFDTAVQEAQRALMAAKIEASSADNGIGLVKLMGRSSGFIAMQASMASGIVDVCLIPEVKFDLHGSHGVLAYVGRLLRKKGHCVICVAEGAGQDLLARTDEFDASGNPKLADIGLHIRKLLKSHFDLVDVKYIDPTYMIRAIETTSQDRIYCRILAHNAVHGAFAGYTGMTVGLVNTHYAYMPIPMVIAQPRTVDPNGKTWNRLRASIGQPSFRPVPVSDLPGAVTSDITISQVSLRG
eukprot:jgi/Ulvmu1/116/UM001_0120.1